MKDSVLVTGGAGYIGSVVVAQLLARGYPVVVLDDLSRGHRAAVAPEATFVQGGVGDRAALDALLRSHRCHALVHLAAYALVGESVVEPEMYRANNVTAGRVLLERAAAAGVRRVVFSSSCAVYGHPSVTPIPEDAPLAPVNPYGETKRDFERVLADYARADGASVVSLRYFNAAGATAHQGEDHVPETHLIPNVLRAASGRQPALDIQGTDYPTPDGTAVRDYVHVLDIADAHVRALEADLTQAGSAGRAATVNLGAGVGDSVLAGAEAARRGSGRAGPGVGRPRPPRGPPPLRAGAGAGGALPRGQGVARLALQPPAARGDQFLLRVEARWFEGQRPGGGDPDRADHDAARGAADGAREGGRGGARRRGALHSLACHVRLREPAPRAARDGAGCDGRVHRDRRRRLGQHRGRGSGRRRSPGDDRRRARGGRPVRHGL